MSTTDPILAERRLRSSELALDAARSRLSEAHQELDELRARVATLEAGLPEQEGQVDDEAVQLRAALAAQERARRAAEQELRAEQERRVELETALARRAEPFVEEVERELGTAQRRAAELEGELEIVRRHAAEFEYEVRLAVDQAWAWLTEMGGRISTALGELEATRTAAGRPGSDQAEPVVPERLDRALERLRASTPAESPQTPARPRRRLLGR